MLNTYSDDGERDFGDDKLLEEIDYAWSALPSPDLLAHGCAERVLLVEGFGPGPNGAMRSLRAPIVKCQHFPAKAHNNAGPIGPLIAVDFLMARVYPRERGVTVLGIVTVGAVGRAGERGQRLLARAGILPPVLATGAEILELIEVAATGSAGGFDPRPARLH